MAQAGLTDRINSGTTLATSEARPLRSHEYEFHYENMPMQYTEIFKVVKYKKKISRKKKLLFFLFLLKHRLWVHVRRGGSNEYPQSMFWSKNKKNSYTPAYPSFTI